MSDDQEILWGVEAIAKAIGRSPRAVYHLLESKPPQIPAKKIGGRWCISRRSLLALFDAVAA